MYYLVEYMYISNEGINLGGQVIEHTELELLMAMRSQVDTGPWLLCRGSHLSNPTATVYIVDFDYY